MNKFPLYDILSKKAENKDLKIAEKKDFLKKIEEVENVHELIYVLIRFYYIKENPDNRGKTNDDTCSSEQCNEINKYTLTPYDSIFNDKNEITFKLNSLPNKLKQIIYKFLIIHFQKLDEEKERKI